jgi:hypothetical protein
MQPQMNGSVFIRVHLWFRFVVLVAALLLCGLCGQIAADGLLEDKDEGKMWWPALLLP